MSLAGEKKAVKNNKVIELIRAGVVNNSAVAKQVGCSRYLVKKLRDEVILTNKQVTEVPDHAQEILITRELIKKETGTIFKMSNVQNSLRKKGLVVDKRLVRESLRYEGFRYKLIKPNFASKSGKARVILKESEIEQFTNVVTTTVCGLKLNDTLCVYVDEFKMSSQEVPRKVWSRTGTIDKKTERKSCEWYGCMSLIVACTPFKFVACESFEKELHCADFQYFMAKLDEKVRRENPSMNIKYIMDNAPWHSSSELADKSIESSLVYNIPAFPLLNFVELTFASLRYFWQSRPEGMTKEQEVESVQRELSRCNNERYFNAYRVQHLRDILLIIDKNVDLFDWSRPEEQPLVLRRRRARVLTQLPATRTPTSM